MPNKHSRVFTVKEQLRNIYFGAKAFVYLRSKRKDRVINKQFKEQIMLAITEVNGCGMCSYMHTRIALSSGMTQEEIKAILDGETSNIPLENAVAVLFAQNFAYEKEIVTDEGLRRIIEEYGITKAECIVAACNMITMTNGMGTSLEHLYDRLRFKRDKRSNIISEVFNPLFTGLLFPILAIYFYVLKLFKNLSFIKTIPTH